MPFALTIFGTAARVQAFNFNPPQYGLYLEIDLSPARARRRYYYQEATDAFFWTVMDDLHMRRGPLLTLGPLLLQAPCEKSKEACSFYPYKLPP